MKNYGAMRFVAGILKLCGWLTIAIGILLIAVMVAGNLNLPRSVGVDQISIALIAALAGGFIILTGIFTVASGEMISALADIATNSHHLPKIAANSEKTVGFFAQITNGSSRAPPVQPQRMPAAQ